MGRLDLERALDLLEEGELPEALEHAERAYRRHPKDPEARFLYGHLRFVLEGSYEGLRLMELGAKALGMEACTHLWRVYGTDFPAHLLDLARFLKQKGLPLPGNTAWAEAVLEEQELPLELAREVERSLYQEDLVSLEGFYRKRPTPYLGYLLVRLYLVRGAFLEARRLAERLAREWGGDWRVDLAVLLARFPQEGPALAEEARPLLARTPRDPHLAEGLALLALGVGEGGVALGLDRAFDPPLRARFPQLEAPLAAAERGEALLPLELFLPRGRADIPLPPFAWEALQPWLPRLEVRDLNLWTRPFLRSGLLSPEDPRLKPEVRDAIRRLGALEEGRPPFVPLASLGELLGASPEEREAAMAALSLEELRHFRKEFPESLLLELYDLLHRPLPEWPERGVRRLLERDLPWGVREALRLRLELKRDPLAPLPAPEPPPGARWPEEFFYTWLLLVPPLEEVEGAFLYPLGGKGALLDWTMVFALRPLRLEVQKPWRQEPLPGGGGLQDWVRRVPLSVRTLWLADLEVEMGLELPADLLDPTALRDLIEELEPEARTLLARLAREERLPLSQVEEKVLGELERRFLAFAGAGEVGVPQDLRATLSRLL
jgi:tetratricopeptide (TPR) repeat protein